LFLAAAAAVNVIPALAGAQITFVNAWGTEGSGNGQFDNPTGVAIGPTGTVYVADYGNERIQVFNSSGVYQSTIGTTGSEGTSNTQFDDPIGVAVGPTGTVYVADTGNDRIQIFNSSGNYESTMGTGSGGTSNTQFAVPRGVAVGGPSGDIYVSDTGNERVQVFNSSGVYQSTIGTTGSIGTGDYQFDNPNQIAVGGPSGFIYVADSGNDRVQIFNSSGGYESTIGTTGSAGTSNTQLNGPGGVAVGPTGIVYIADSVNNRIQVFNSSGVYQTTIGSTTAGTGDGEFNVPTNVAVAPSGMLYVADINNNRIQQFFDPASWTSGTDTFTNSSTGPTSISLGLSGETLTVSSSMGLAVGSTTTVNASSTLVQSGGPISSGALTVNGTFDYQNGTHLLGAIGVESGGTFTGAPFTINSSESLNLFSGGAVSSSDLTIAAGATMTQSGGTLSAAVLNIAGEFTYSSGTFSPGSVLIQSGGELSQASLSNAGVIQVLAGGLLAVGQTSNLTNTASGQLTGAGTVTTGVTNSGIIEPIGGVMTFTAAVNNLNTIIVPTGAQGLFENLGYNGSTISLSGGTFNSNGNTLTNAGQILGSGILETGGLINSSTVALSGQSSVYGAVSNSSTGLIHLSGTGFNVFYGAVTNNGTLDVDAGASGTIYGAYTGSGKIIDYGSLYLNASSVAGPISGNGNLTIGSTSSGPAVVALNLSSGLSEQGALTLLANSTLDITNNHFIINYGAGSDPISAIYSYLKSGFNGGAWNGAGVISSTAQTPTNGLKYGVGWADGADGIVTGLSSGQIELKYTLLGDANLDGTVNGSDFSILAANFGKGVTNWDQGNFLYGSSVNGSDFAALAANFGQGDSGADTTISAADIAALDSFAIANGLPLPTFAAVPEPAAYSLLLLSVVGTLYRRRRILQAPLLPSPGTPGEVRVGVFCIFSSHMRLRWDVSPSSLP
jgi:sugar lactone lactonase YvrE